ncbi:hypothetical protein ACW0JT_14980 [Arthrobacter sp. SA17]
MPTDSIDDGDRRTETSRTPVWRPVDDRWRTTVCEQDIPKKVAVDNLRGSVDRPVLRHEQFEILIGRQGASPHAIRSALLHGSFDSAMKAGHARPAIAR